MEWTDPEHPTSDLRFITIDAMSLETREAFEPHGPSYGWKLNGAGAFSAEVDMHDERSTMTVFEPGRTLIAVEDQRLDRIEWCGVMWLPPTRMSEHMMRVEAAEMWSYMQFLLVSEDRSYFNFRGDVALDLVQYGLSKPGVMSGWTVAGETVGNGIFQKYLGDDLHSILEIVEELAGHEGGFDFDVLTSFNGLLVCHQFAVYARKGSMISDPLVWGENVTDYAPSGREIAVNVVEGSGGTNTQRLRSTATDAASVTSGPRVEIATAMSDAQSQSMLDEATNAVLTRRKGVWRSMQLTIDPSTTQPAWGTYGVGDSVHVVVDDVFWKIDDWYRIIEMTNAPDGVPRQYENHPVLTVVKDTEVST